MSIPNMEPARVDGARHVSEDLTPERCWDLLRSRETGRFGFVHHGRVMILPVHYLVRDHAIYFRTAATGFVGEPSARMQTSFEVDQTWPDRSEGWSVLVSGPSSHVTEPGLVKQLFGKAMPEPWAGGERNLFIRVQPDIISGRHVHLS
ncbi:pyridoxamine 5'-phosphate oxidase family protein [Paenarthrobacter nicotinovorans]|jgi:uncharacterized protein|uniref:pyridoxamine 5'-phosphate oxidase family protein n=1 Tax=Paenarthrobacter nicotinovorans TaxID=29320 RepID=UPI003814A483